MIRFLLHLAGDIHQPMHNTTRFSDRFPEGDRGGNNYKLRGQIKNLHAFWDWGGGFLGDQSTVHALADQAMAAFTFEQAQGLIEQPVSAWSQESYFIAVSMAYQVEENSEPDQEYAEAVQQISKERLALAGYRLAHVLNILFKR